MSALYTEAVYPAQPETADNSPLIDLALNDNDYQLRFGGAMLSSLPVLRVLSLGLLLAIPTASVSWADQTGTLLLAHGQHAMSDTAGHDHHHAPPTPSTNPWNQNVEKLAATLNSSTPTEVAFGMAEPESIQAAVDRLTARGVSDIVAVPLFISSHSPIIENFQYILGLRSTLAAKTSLKSLEKVKTTARFRFTSALDSSPLVSQILLERAKGLTKSPATTTVVLIAHGPNDEEDNKLWQKDMSAHAAYLRAKGGFRSAEFLTIRDDAEGPVKNAAIADFRKRVEDGSKIGPAVVVPVLLSEGGIEEEVEGTLKGLKYAFAKPLMPHPNFVLWVKEQINHKDN